MSLTNVSWQNDIAVDDFQRALVGQRQTLPQRVVGLVEIDVDNIARGPVPGAAVLF